MAISAPRTCRMARSAATRGGEPLVGHEALGVLDHHDRVVHHDADGEHQREQGEHVDREAEQRAGRGRCRSR